MAGMAVVIFSSLALAIGAVFYAAIGVRALVRPRGLLIGFGIVADTPDAANEVRAVYGGLTLAFAGMFAAALVSPSPMSGGLVLAVAVASFGMAGGRLVSWLIDRAIGRLPLVFLSLELVVSVLLSIPLLRSSG